MADAVRRVSPGAASALVDWDGAEIARLRAFGIVHGIVVRDLGPGERARFCATLDAGPEARGHARWSEHAEQTTRAPGEPALHPAVGQAAARGRRRRGVPVPQPQELGGAGVPAPRRTPADPDASWPPCSSPRPTTRCARCAGAWPRSGGGWAPDAELDGDPVRAPAAGRTRRSTSTSLARGDWDDAVAAAPGSGRTCSTASPSRRRGLRVLAARPAPPARGGGRVDPARGGPGPSGPRRARPRSRLARRAAVMSPLDENHQALLIRLYRLAGDDDAAERQFAAWSARRGAGARHAARCRGAAGDARATAVGRGPSTTASIHAVTEAGAAAVVRRRRWRPASRRSRPRSAWPTRPAPRACGSRPGWCSPRRSSTPWAAWTRRGWRP